MYAEYEYYPLCIRVSASNASGWAVVSIRRAYACSATEQPAVGSNKAKQAPTAVLFSSQTPHVARATPYIPGRPAAATTAQLRRRTR